MMRLFLVPVTFFLFFACCSGLRPAHAAISEGDRPELDFRRINVELLENSDAVVRSDTHHLRQSATLSLRHEHNRIITITRQSGLDEAKLQILQLEGEEIRELEARLYDDEGAFVQRIGKAEFEQQEQFFSTNADGPLIEFSAEFQPGSLPFTLHLRVVKMIDGPGEFPRWRPAGDGIALEKGLYSIELPPGQRIFAERYPQDEAFEASVEQTPDGRRYSWELRNFQSRRLERNAPPPRELFPTLAARPLLINKHGYHGRLERWNDVGNWLRSLRFGRHHLAPEDMVLARRLRPVGPELQKLLDMRVDIDEIRRIKPLPAPPPRPPLPNTYWERVFANLRNPDFYEQPGLAWVPRLAYQAKFPRPEPEEETAPEELQLPPPDDFQVLNALLRHVVRRAGPRYEERPMHIHDFVPVMPRELLRRQHIDADDLSYYLRSLLKFAGIEAYQAFLASNQHAPQAWAEMQQPGLRFDHAVTVAVVEGDTLWIDPGNLQSNFPLSYLGYGVSNRRALLLREHDAVLLNTPPLDAGRNRQRREAGVALTATGEARARISTEYTGQQHEFIRRLAAMPAEQQQYALFQNLAINEYRIEELRAEAEEQLPIARLELDLSISRLANTPGNQVVFRPNLLERRTLNIAVAEPRRQPVVISYGYEDEDTITYTLPPGYRVEKLPESVDLSFPLGFYKVDIRLSDDEKRIHYARHLRIESGRIPAENYRTYIDFMNGMYREDNREVVLVKD